MTATRKEVAARISRSVDMVDVAVNNDELDYAVITQRNKPVVVNGKYKKFLKKYHGQANNI